MGAQTHFEDLSGRWSACAVLTDRLRTLQVRGMTLDAKLEQLCSDMHLAETVREAGAGHESHTLSTAPLRVEAVASVSTSPTHTPCRWKRAARFTDPSASILNNSAQRTPASRRREASVSPLIHVEVMDEDQHNDAVQPAPGDRETDALSHSPMAAATGGGCAAEERKTMVSFVLEQIEQIHVPITEVSRQFREENCSVEQEEQTQKDSAVAATAPSKGVNETFVAVAESAPAQHTSTMLSSITEATHTSPEAPTAITTAALSGGSALSLLSPEKNNAAPPAPREEVKPVPPVAIVPGEVVMEVDYDRLAEEALRRGEWKEAKDKKGRLYYYKPKERKVCWNLSKELRLRVEGTTPTL